MSGAFIPNFLNPAVRAAARKEKGGAPEDARRGNDMSNVAELLRGGQPAALKSTVEIVTPQQARVLRDTAHFDRQRNISPVNVTRLANEMAKGHFTRGTQIYICVLPNGKELIVNGNHTLEAVSECGIPQILTITRTEVKNVDEAGRIYAVFDIQKTRSWGDSLRATGAGDDIPLATKVLTAIGIIENGFGHGSWGQPASRTDRINSLEEYRDAACMFAAAIHYGPKANVRYLKRGPLMAVALETFRYQPSLAAEFWFRAAQDEGLVTGNPEKALLGWLRNVRTIAGQGGQREYCRAAALAWNAAFKGRDLMVVKPNQMAAFFLLGTPWANGLER